VRGAVVLLAGPTASGKSRLALDLAGESHGIVINADSMQVYRELRVLSARPDAEDEAAATHRLYGHVEARTRYSVGAWLADASAALAEARAAGRPAVVVGGTGLYFKALTEGLAPVPAIPAALRAGLLAETSGLESAELHARLAALDPEDAAAVRPSDRTRIVRALEVFTATGASLAEWKRGASSTPLVDASAAERIVLMPDRAELHRRIAARAERMVHVGAIEEVRALLAQGLDPDLPAMKAIGVRELRDHLAGRMSLDEATAAIKTETRRYAKRQMTWFRNQMSDWPRRE
ncbi:MAG: tRNA (adenosine(37)-N6)-dimethylallyltransferase MiaA, partial [Bauldia sp.]